MIAASSAWISASTSFYRCCCCCKSRLLLEQGTRLDRSLRCSERFVERTICSVFLEIKTPSTRTRLLRIMSLVISAVFCIRTLVDSVQFHCLISLYICTTSYASHSLIFLFRCIVLHCFDAFELLWGAVWALQGMEGKSLFSTVGNDWLRTTIAVPILFAGRVLQV